MLERVSPRDVDEDNPFLVLLCVCQMDDVFDILDGVVGASVLRSRILIYVIRMRGLRCLSFLVPSCPLIQQHQPSWFIVQLIRVAWSWLLLNGAGGVTLKVSVISGSGRLVGEITSLVCVGGVIEGDLLWYYLGL